MSVTSDQIETLKRFAPTLQAVLDLVAVFEKVASIDQAVAESNARLQRARDAEASFKAELMGQRDAIEQERKAAAAMTEQASNDAAAIRAAAQADGEKLVAAAKAEADAHVAALDENRGLLSAVQNDVAEKQAELAQVQAQVAEFEATLAAKKDELRKLLGG